MIKTNFNFNIEFTFSGIKRSDLPESDPLHAFRFTRAGDYFVGGVLYISSDNTPLIVDSSGSPGVSDYCWTPFIQILKDAIPAIINGNSMQIDFFDNPHHLTFVPTYDDELFIYFISAVSGTHPYRVCHVRKIVFFNTIFECANDTINSIVNFDPDMESSEMMTDLKSALSTGRSLVMNSRYH
ncbi:MAG: hypothetical protein A4E35_00525 [Methanoregula sp. PtaU1.Bin051]|nr:MAG: hypothetical protein A4E35_00525 [Methanoregula sp. PtaU1.Bin051]